MRVRLLLALAFAVALAGCLAAWPLDVGSVGVGPSFGNASLRESAPRVDYDLLTGALRVFANATGTTSGLQHATLTAFLVAGPCPYSPGPGAPAVASAIDRRETFLPDSGSFGVDVAFETHAAPGEEEHVAWVLRAGNLLFDEYGCGSFRALPVQGASPTAGGTGSWYTASAAASQSTRAPCSASTCTR